MPLTFSERHNGPRLADIDRMLSVVGEPDLESLIQKTLPQDIRLAKPLALDAPLSEAQFLQKIKEIANKNKTMRSMIGMGYYGTAMPAVIQRNIFENPGWYTSYTPYQAEISQGRLEALFNFQTMICSLTGFSLANCSLLDEATAAAEAMRMLFELRPRAAVKEGKNVFLAHTGLFPQTLSVMKTRAASLGIDLVIGSIEEPLPEKCYGVMVQYPCADGELRDYTAFAAACHSAGVMVAAACDLMALAVLKEPAAWGADVAIGSIQRFGLPMGFGGPHAGYMACSDTYRRNIPGRIIGRSIDRLGRPAYRMALQTREQHIKREKATSNICTASALMATMAGFYAMWHGSIGIKEISLNGCRRAHAVAKHLVAGGYRLAHEVFYDTFELIDVDAALIRTKAEAAGFNFYYPSASSVRISFDELSCCRENRAILSIFGLSHGEGACHHNGGSSCFTLPVAFMRKEDALTQKIFNTYHCESDMMRYMKTLEQRDISLAHSMIPLGSCTMKLNAAAEMLPLAWPEFANVHPFAPLSQCEGYMEMIHELMHDLCVITGFDACSLQPNSGAAGEYAGLSVIRGWHRAHQTGRNLAIIPSSAHGTNPASAAMAGMDIITVSCDENGNINVDELRRQAEEHKDRLACMMITYPSTHGVFEVRIKEIISIIHENGGLVYMDGANMNAQVGLTNPGTIGADVCHLNLHKTFAMPHGGGGPGVGPICCTKALAPYLPGHPLVNPNPAFDASGTMTAVSAAPFGSPMLLPITYGYIKMLGEEGLRHASETAILNANYLSVLLAPRLQTLYSGATGRVAHECIIDLRHFAKTYGVDAGDVAKRLMDFGFHAPTLSFPVHETLMIEPTESESKEEIDRFADALCCILEECEALKAGNWTPTDNPLKNAPHTALECTADIWEHPYPRSQAAYPREWIANHKFWPHVTRVDNGYGDRNLIARDE